jgi:thioredoxin 1
MSSPPISNLRAQLQYSLSTTHPKEIFLFSSHQEHIMASEHVQNITDASFEADVLQAKTAVLVDYWAPWCGPCKMIAPVLDELAQEYTGRLSIAKLNVDENSQIPAQFGIRGIPTLMIFKNGQLAGTKVGAVSKTQLTEFIDSHL